jgi:hypothetical protein
MWPTCGFGRMERRMVREVGGNGVEWEGGEKKEITKYISYTQYVS